MQSYAMQGHQNPNQTKNLNGVLGWPNFWFSQPSKPKKNQVGLVDGFAKLSKWNNRFAKLLVRLGWTGILVFYTFLSDSCSANLTFPYSSISELTVHAYKKRFNYSQTY